MDGIDNDGGKLHMLGIYIYVTFIMKVKQAGLFLALKNLAVFI